MAEVERMSSMLLRLYAISLDRSAPDFLPSALGELRRLLPFDSAWWALTTVSEGRFAFQASYVEGLPYEMDGLWLSIQEDDVIGHAVLAQPGRTLNFAPATVERTPGSRWLARRTGFRHVLCTQMHNPVTDQHAFLALDTTTSRGSPRPSGGSKSFSCNTSARRRRSTRRPISDICAPVAASQTAPRPFSTELETSMFKTYASLVWSDRNGRIGADPASLSRFANASKERRSFKGRGSTPRRHRSVRSSSLN